MTTRSARAVARTLSPAPLRRLYRKRRVAKLIGDYENRQVTHTYGGAKLTIELADGPSEPYYAVTGACRRRSSTPGGVVFSLGRSCSTWARTRGWWRCSWRTS